MSMDIKAAVGKYREHNDEYPLNIFKVSVLLCNIEKRGYPVSVLQHIISALQQSSSDPQKLKCPRKLTSQVNYTNQIFDDTFFPPTRLAGLNNDEAIKFKVTTTSIVNLQSIAKPKNIRRNI